MAVPQRIAAASTYPVLRTRGPRIGYICLHCQIRALSTLRQPLRPCRNITRSQLRRYASQRPKEDDDDGFEGSFANKVRKKLWGTDNPPGQRNPYVRELPDEEEDRLREDAEREAREIEEADFARIREGGEIEKVVVRQQDVVDDVAEEDEEEEEEEEVEQRKEYKPATTWRGLRVIPGWKVAQQKPKPWFEGFLASQKVESMDGIERAIQRALVEVWTMKQETGSPNLPAKVGNPSDDYEERLATGVNFNSDTSLVFKDGTLQEDIARSLGLRHDEWAKAGKKEENLDHMSEDVLEGERFGRSTAYPAEMDASDQEPLMEDQVVEEPVTKRTEDVIAIGDPEEVVKNNEMPPSPVDESYQQVAFQQPDLKFAVLKRVMQLTGNRIPDPAIPRLNTAASLFKFLVKPPPAKHLVDDLRDITALQGLPNLQISAERLTMKRKEIEIGRWKLIEAELSKRGVPSEPEIAVLESEMGKVDDHVLPLVRQKEKKLRRRRNATVAAEA